jgi:hypothetical protein
MEKLERVISSYESIYGKSGPVHYESFLGQVRELIETRRSGQRAQLVNLGGTGEARRKHNLLWLFLHRSPLLAMHEASKIRQRIFSLVRVKLERMFIRKRF